MLPKTSRTYVPFREVKGHVVREWQRRKPERRGWNAVPCAVGRFLLDDGRLVEQEAWSPEGRSAHYVIGLPGSKRLADKVAECETDAWQESEPGEYPLRGGRRT